MNNKYYIQDERQYVGNSMLWWAKDSNGYTTDIHKAHVYTKEEAEKKCSNRKTDIMWLKDYIDQKISCHIDGQYVSLKEMNNCKKN